MAWAAAAIGALARPRKVDVRAHLSGDDAVTQRLRGFLVPAGVQTSAFSPAPNPEAPGEGFWKTTLAVVPAVPGSHAGSLLARDRHDRKVEWDCLLVAIALDESPGTLSAEQIRGPDLWIASGPDAAYVARSWRAAGAGAVAALDAFRAVWFSANATFGNSEGSKELSGGSPAEAAAREGTPPLPLFAAGIVDGMLEELLGESLFAKTTVRVERECLEARPLHLSRACETGLAVVAALNSADEAARERSFHKPGELTSHVRGHLTRLLTPEGTPWGTRGR